MDVYIYIGLSLVYFLLGVIAVIKFKYKDFALKAFLVLTVLLPITKFTTNFHIKAQLSIYYYFFIGLGLLYIIKIFHRRRISGKVLQGLVIVLPLLTFYLIHYYTLVTEKREVINVLKDIKPFLLIIMAYLFIDHFKSRLANLLTRRFCNWLMFFCVIVCSVFYYLMTKYNIHLLLTDDPYYKFEELRFESLGCYFGLFYILYLIFNNTRPTLQEIVLAIIPLLYTGNRTLIFAVLLIVIIYYLMRASVAKIIAFLSSIIVLFSGFLFLVARAEEESPLFRFQKLLSMDYIEEALLIRFSPFIEAIRTFSVDEFIIGKGLGFTFFIPWFEWRETIDNNNIYIDNLYLTLYSKFGIFFFVLFLSLFLFLSAYRNRTTAFFFFLFVLIISITNAFIYQFNFLWILIVFVLPFSVQAKKMV